ncbi:MAG: PrsW family intramembrane metalloprotease [Candidatus Aminicenantes bacterium]|nr:MAG: PrsW family intramembrane metalloprotease [Candidatus Aminicenantes bacterium]
MTFLIILSGIIAPAIFWICYFYYKDRFQPEPIRNLGISYLLGIATAFACIKFYGLLPFVGLPDDLSALMNSHRIQFLLYSLGVTGVVEEFFKLLPFLFIITRFKAFDEKIDGIIYASMIALGFASFENISYLAYMDGLELVGRAFASPLTHTIFSSIWGYAIGVARIYKKSILIASLWSILLAAFIHGIFNFFTTSPALRLLSALVILLIWIWRIRILERGQTSNLDI